MKYLPFILKHLRRNWLRTASTVLAMAACIFLFCTLQSVLAEINGLLNSKSANHPITRHPVTVVFPLPIPYGERIKSVRGVKQVALTSWFGGSLPAKREGNADEGGDSTAPDWSQFVPSLAIDAEPYLSMYPEYFFQPYDRRPLIQHLSAR